jgi:hypothetical protein
MITGGSWEWLERVDCSTGAPTHAHIQLWTQRLAEGVYDMDIGDGAFKAVMQRAAARGYHAEMRDTKTYTVHDLVMYLGPGQADAVVQRTRLLEAHELPGAPLLVTLRITDTLPFSAFPCGDPPHDIRLVRALRLRLHPRACLVLEAHRSEGCSAVVRGVHLEVTLKKTSDKSTTTTTPDPYLRACVEAAVHSVLLGQPKKSSTSARLTRRTLPTSL